VRRAAMDLLADTMLRAKAAYWWEWQRLYQTGIGAIDAPAVQVLERDNEWRRVVRSIEHCRAVPETYIHALWHSAVFFVTVKASYGAKAQESYNAYALNLSARLAGQLATATQRLRVATRQRELAGGGDVVGREAVALILSEPQSTLPVLFRFCVATRLPHPALCDQFYEDAVAQYVTTRREYDQSWGEYIPPAITESATNYIQTRMQWLIR